MNNSNQQDPGVEQWFALQVKCRHEKSIAQHLQDKGYEAIAPSTCGLRRSANSTQDQELALFPGYVFGKFDVRFRLPILMTPGIRCVVGYGKVPVAIEVAEMNAVQDVLRSCVPVERCNYLAEGERVRVVSGPLTGLQGVLLKVRSSYRVVVSVELIQQSIRIEVDPEMVVPDHPLVRPFPSRIAS